MCMRAVIIPAIAILAPFTFAPVCSHAQDRPTSESDLVQADSVDLNDAIAMRSAGEAAVRQHLIDPASAIFE